MTWQVGIEFVLRNYAFQVSLADKMKQLFAHALNVIAAQQDEILLVRDCTNSLDTEGFG